MPKKIKVVVDAAIPFLDGVLEPYAEVVRKEGRQIGPEDVADASALLVRTRTRCNAALLEGSSVRFIATATIGTDHIDFGYCNSKGIMVTNAAGCNAGGVMNYVFSALYGVAARKGLPLDGMTMGIVGVGNVGRLVERVAGILGFKVLKNDPPRMASEGPYGFSTLEDLLAQSDIVTMHVPLEASTTGMCDDAFFSGMKDGSIFINAARGEIVDESALKRHASKFKALILDTWNNEPDIDRELLEMTDIATPHIAGYSYRGKQNGTAAAVRAFARYFAIEPLYDFFPKTEYLELESVKLDVKGRTQGEIASLLQYNYPVFTDDFMLRTAPEEFETLRSDYKYRREFYID